MKLLALSGSLRARSYNRAALNALSELSPNDVTLEIGDIKDLPLFNPDLDETQIAALQRLKAQLAQASGLIIASPEYAHGISGPMKNALDWLVSDVEFSHKPIMLINTSPRASHGLAALREVLTTMSGVIIDSAFVSIQLLSSEPDKEVILENSELSGMLTAGLEEFCHQIRLLNGVNR